MLKKAIEMMVGIYRETVQALRDYEAIMAKHGSFAQIREVSQPMRHEQQRLSAVMARGGEDRAVGILEECWSMPRGVVENIERRMGVAATVLAPYVWGLGFTRRLGA